MIVCAAVKVFLYPLNKEITIRCHRHCDAFLMLKEFGYKHKDFKEIAQGFLDENDNFYSRVEAWKHARKHYQIDGDYDNPKELFSEDLW